MDGGHASVDVSQVIDCSTKCKSDGSTHNMLTLFSPMELSVCTMVLGRSLVRALSICCRPKDQTPDNFPPRHLAHLAVRHTIFQQPARRRTDGQP